MSIAPKSPKPTAREEREAYELVELRDGGCLFRAWDCAGVVQRDHRKNRSQRGLTTVENLQLLCLKHHQWATEHPADATAEGWAVPGWADPLIYPGRRWVRVGVTYRPVWVLYLRDGTWQQITEADALRRIDGREIA